MLAIRVPAALKRLQRSHVARRDRRTFHAAEREFGAGHGGFSSGNPDGLVDDGVDDVRPHGIIVSAHVDVVVAGLQRAARMKKLPPDPPPSSIATCSAEPIRQSADEVRIARREDRDLRRRRHGEPEVVVVGFAMDRAGGCCAPKGRTVAAERWLAWSSANSTATPRAARSGDLLRRRRRGQRVALQGRPGRRRRARVFSSSGAMSRTSLRGQPQLLERRQMGQRCDVRDPIAVEVDTRQVDRTLQARQVRDSLPGCGEGDSSAARSAGLIAAFGVLPSASVTMARRFRVRQDRRIGILVRLEDVRSANGFVGTPGLRRSSRPN